MEDVPEGKDVSFPAEEERILRYWDEIDAFAQQLKLNEGKKEFVFYDGPPFATGLPHYGHILAGTLKDVVTRYAAQTGHYVERRFGWDCHGLPVEFEIDKKLGITGPEDVAKIGIATYNEECRAIVMRYAGEWRATVTRLGRWIDFDNDYKTLEPSFMESVWWAFGQLWDKELVYRGYKVMPYSTALSTTLSNFEAGLNYKDVSDPAVMVSFPVVGDADGAELVAWTTTPWTLPSNLALCVHPELEYVRARDPGSGRTYIVAAARLHTLPGAVPKKVKGKGKGAEGGAQVAKGFEVTARMPGTELVGLHYTPLFDYFTPEFGDTAFRVVCDTYVTDDSGTGVVHQAPAFGEDDSRVCLAAEIVALGATVPCPVDAAGRFTGDVPDFAGVHVKEADKGIVAHLKASGRLVDSSSIVHSYPFCWRSDTPLIYKAVPSYFVRVEALRERLLANTEATRWVPAYVKEKRFRKWLEGARDWAISRSRFWGTPLPVWASADGEETVVVSSIAQLEALTGAKVTDIHRHFIDDLTIPSKRPGGAPLRRVPDVFDCWFESGSMPYAQMHYPFENKERFEANFPADFIAEGLDQTRGWFYTLMVLSTALFDRPAFRNLVCNGLVLAADGKKMSKRLKNYPDPLEVVGKHGADALRLYLINSPVVRAEPLRFEERAVFAVIKDVFLPWYNAYRFLAQNVARVQASGAAFSPEAVLAAAEPTNVLDRWLLAATRSLVRTVRAEMEGYRLYNVVPALVRFLESLTNVYVRYNRRRLKSHGSDSDTQLALAVLFDTLHKVCILMAPLTPFLTESMFQNLRRCLPEGAPASVHFVQIPAAEPPRADDSHIEHSVGRMQSVIELGRTVRDRHSIGLRTPLPLLIVAHAEPEFVADLTGELKAYVLEELNVAALATAPPDAHSALVMQPNWKALGTRLGRDMPAVGKAVRAMATEDIAAFQAAGRMTVEGHDLTTDEIVVKRELKASAEGTDAATDGDAVVVLSLQPDAALLARRTARELVNRYQKLRKKARLVPGDPVEAFFAAPSDAGEVPNGLATREGAANGAATAATPSKEQSTDEASDGLRALAELAVAEAEWIRGVLGGDVLLATLRPRGGVVLARETTSVELPDGAVVAFDAVITAPAPSVARGALEALGGAEVAEAVELWAASKGLARLKQEAEGGGGRVKARLDGREWELEVGKHLFWSAAAVPR